MSTRNFLFFIIVRVCIFFILVKYSSKRATLFHFSRARLLEPTERCCNRHSRAPTWAARIAGIDMLMTAASFNRRTSSSSSSSAFLLCVLLLLLLHPYYAIKIGKFKMSKLFPWNKWRHHKFTTTTTTTPAPSRRDDLVINPEAYMTSVCSISVLLHERFDRVRFIDISLLWWWWCRCIFGARFYCAV